MWDMGVGGTDTVSNSSEQRGLIGTGSVRPGGSLGGMTPSETWTHLEIIWKQPSISSITERLGSVTSHYFHYSASIA